MEPIEYNYWTERQQHEQRIRMLAELRETLGVLAALRQPGILLVYQEQERVFGGRIDELLAWLSPPGSPKSETDAHATR